MERARSHPGLLLGGVTGISLLLLVASVVYFRAAIQSISAYGYMGVFVISILGGATVLIPIPALLVVFTLGSVLNPLWVGVAAGLGEALGALTIYLTGRGGRFAFSLRPQGNACPQEEGKEWGRWHRWYDWCRAFSCKMEEWVKRKGGWAIFVLSAILNPFFYPTAIAAGALRFQIHKFFLITWAGKTVKGVGVALAGYWGLLSIFRLLGIGGF